MDSKPPKALEGGYAVGDVVYFIGFSCDLADGDRLVHGTQGEVIGPSTRTYNDDSGKEFLGICVQFPGNTKSTNINLKLKGGVRRAPRRLLCPPCTPLVHLSRLQPRTSRRDGAMVCARWERRWTARRRHCFQVATNWATRCTTSARRTRLAMATSSAMASKAW